MKEAKHMVWMLLGVAVGLGAGLYLLLKVFQWTGGSIAESPVLVIVLAIPILGGGLMGGGYLAQWLVYKYEKRKRQIRKAEKEQATFGAKKRKK